MDANDMTIDERSRWGGACARCGQPVLDIFRGVIHRSALYHSPCWLQLMSAAARADRRCATELISGAKDVDGAC
jgi:hypothetical protein